MPIPVKGDQFVVKEKGQDGAHLTKTVHSVVGQPLPDDTGGIYLVFCHDIHRDIIPHETEDGTVAGHEQARFAIKYNDVLGRWEENNL